MHEVFSKIIERFEDKRKTAELLIMENPHDELDRIQTQTAEDFSSAYKDAIEIVNRAAAEYNNGWIPCSEPPKTSDYILLSFSNFSVPMVGRYEENDDGGAYYIGDEDKSCVSQDIFVNAWQPLPEPYQPKGE